MELSDDVIEVEAIIKVSLEMLVLVNKVCMCRKSITVDSR